MLRAEVMAHEPAMGTGRVEAREPRGAELAEASWSGGRIVLCRRSWAAREAELSWRAPFHSLLLTERGKTARTRVKVDGRIVYDGGDRAGALSVVPAGLQREASYRDAQIEYTALWFDPGLGATLFPGASGPEPLSLHVNGRESVVAALLADLSASTARGEDPGTLYVEQLLALSWSRLARARGVQAPRRRVAALPRQLVARVAEYVAENLEQDLSVSELARLAELEPDSFARRFKAATGLAPHAFVLEQRLQRAERLLAGTQLGIAAIALQAGFATQSHLTETFRRVRGVTPHVYRRSFLPGSR
jgi:AraC family transcriptional regulator